MPKRKGKKSAINDIDLGIPTEEPAMDDWDSDDGANGAPQQSRIESIPQATEDDNVEPPEQPRRKRDMNDDSDDDMTSRKKKKKKKKKKKNRNVDDEETVESIDTAPPSEDVSADVSEISEEPSQGGRKKKKKKKKKKGQQQQQNDDDDIDLEPAVPPPSDDFADDEVSKGNKKKKNKKKKKKGRAADDDDDNFSEPPPPPPVEPVVTNEEETGGGKKKKKKKKNKNKKSLAQRAEERGQMLFEFAKELQANLDDDLVEFFNDDEAELFMGVVTDALEEYQDDHQLADDEEFFEGKKAEIVDFWEQLVSGMKEFRDIAQAGEAEETAAREREERIEALKKQGFKIGPRGEARQRVDHKAEKRRAEREKLRQARLLLQRQQEEAAARGDDDDEEDDDDDEDEDSKDGEDQEDEKEQDENADKGDSDWDDSDDEPPAKPAKPARRAPARQRARRGGDDSGSDDDGPRQQKKKRNRRRGGGGGGGPQPQQKQQKPKQKQQRNQSKTKQPSPPAAAERQDERQTSAQRPEPVPAEEEKVAEQGKKGKDKGKRKKVPLRSPICVVMGHVDAGKTKILDKIRSSDVQGGEVGGITQQIGATYLSIENVKSRTELLKEHFGKLKYKVPGLLFIDTPGHESFSNLRSRGSSMCDIAVLVVNIMEGIQPQTIESLNMLREKGAQFVVAVNQIDRLNQWVPMPDAPFKTTLASQNRAAQNHFESLMSRLTVQFAEHSWNTALYYENKRVQEDMSLVPVSAHTGEGLPDLLMVVVRLTQKFMTHQLELSLAPEDFRCTILEVKNTVGHGATIDVILSNGMLRSDDTIVVCGMRGPIVTPIRALLLPHEAQEMRVRGEYRLVDEVPASAGIRISAHDLATAVAGSSILLVPRDLPKRGPRRGQIMEALKDDVQSEFARIMSNVSSTSHGVYVQASTLGALEALVKYLGDMKVPISGINIGDVHKSDVMKAGIMLEFRPEFALILAFNIRVTPEAEQIARQMGVRIFAEEIIYHLFDRFKEYIEADREDKKRRARDIAVFPCRLEIMQEHIINNRRPLIMGCLVRRGCLRLRTPLVAQKPDGSGDYVYLGRVESIQSEGKDQEIAQVGDKVAVKIVDNTATVTIQYGRQFDHTFPLISLVSRESIDALKTNFKDELVKNTDDVAHLRELKRFFNILG